MLLFSLGMLQLWPTGPLTVNVDVPEGEVHEECSWNSVGWDGRRVRGGQSHHTSQQHQGVWQEAQRLVRSELNPLNSPPPATASLTCASSSLCAVCQSSTPSSPARCLSWRTAAAATRTLPWRETTASAAPDRPPKTSSSLRRQCCTTTMFLHVCHKTIYSGWGHYFWWATTWSVLFVT